MDKSEFERIKAEEKAHLRKLRALKQQHRGVSRQKKVLDALSAMQQPDLDATHEETLRHLTEDAAMSEARLEIAMEDAGVTPEAAALTEADRERLRKEEAAALIRQMKAEMGTPASEMGGDTEAAAQAAQAERTIGRSPASPSDLLRDEQAGGAAKSIGRASTDTEDDGADAPPAPSKSIGRKRHD